MEAVNKPLHTVLNTHQLTWRAEQTHENDFLHLTTHQRFLNYWLVFAKEESYLVTYSKKKISANISLITC